MQVTLADFVEGARNARGLVVVIDVFRAFSLAAYAFAQGARQIVPVASVDDARALKEAHPEWLLVGERHTRPLPGFDCGNSPTELEKLDLRGRTLIHTTHAGTQGLTAATNAREVVTGALVNAGALVRYIRTRQPGEVTLVRMGHEARERCVEDDFCAEVIRARLLDAAATAPDPAERLRDAPSARKFFDPACDWAPRRDFDLCARLDAFDFVLRRNTDGEGMHLTRVDVPGEIG
jgi:2-phosphosulfolactate phosphatase